MDTPRTKLTPDEIHAYEISQLYEWGRRKDADYLWMVNMYTELLQDIGTALEMDGQFKQDYGVSAMVAKIQALMATNETSS